MHIPDIVSPWIINKQEESAWAPILRFCPDAGVAGGEEPEVLVYIFNDPVTLSFSIIFGVQLGIDDHYEVADEGGGPRDLPPVKGHAALSQHIGASLMADEFDMSFFQDKPLDHGLFSPLSALLPHDGGWPTQIVPLQIGVLQFPIPTARRCYKLGQALRRAIESFPEDLNVAIVATGGVSHQVHGERRVLQPGLGRSLSYDVNDPQSLTEMTLADSPARGLKARSDPGV